MREYDLIADWYAAERIDQTGIPETVALASSIPPGSRVLDIGCGNGIPITRALLRAGHMVIGLDSSSAMLERLRDNCPEPPVIRGVVQACPFANRIFDAAVARGVMFHLSRENQIQCRAAVKSRISQEQVDLSHFNRGRNAGMALKSRTKSRPPGVAFAGLVDLSMIRVHGSTVRARMSRR